MTSIWDDPELAVNDDFIKFDTVGDTASGTVRSIRAHRFDDGKVAPQLLLLCDDGEERTVSAGQVRLKALLAEHRPEVGDHVTIGFTQEEKRAGGKTLKHFTLEVKRDGAGTAPAATPAAAAPAVDQAAVAAALAALTPEQRQAMGLPAA